MNLRLFNLYLLVFWLFVGLALLFRKQFLPDQPTSPERDRNLDLLAYFALALAAWNVFRWWMVRSMRRSREAAEAAYRAHVGPLAPKDPPPITDPQFQFDKPDLPPPPPPNGRSH